MPGEELEHVQDDKTRKTRTGHGDFWPRRPENARLALEDGKLVWSWVDRIGRNKDGAEQEWRLVLDAEKEPSPDAAFKVELVTGKSRVK